MFRIVIGLCVLASVSGQWDFEDDTGCTTPDRKAGTCISIRNCPFIIDIIQKAPRPLPRPVVTMLQSYSCGFEGSAPKVCCPPIPMPTVPPTVTTRPGVGATGSQDPPNVSQHRNFRMINGENCGAVIDDRIFGGNKTALMQYPWMSLIAYNTQSGLGFRCGATLINDRYILTAAHCISNLGTLTLAGVRLGEHNIQTDVDCETQQGQEICAPPVQDFSISEVIPHPQYNPTRYENDIGLLRLATAANLSQENISPICLPVGDLWRTNLTRRNLIVSGWGATETGYASPDLLKVAIPYIPNQECGERYNRSRSPIQIGPRQMCAGGSIGKDSCTGDSGGPLMYTGLIDGDLRFVQFGVVSFGPRNCGSEGLPGVYTRIAYYMDWILDNIKP